MRKEGKISAKHAKNIDIYRDITYYIKRVSKIAKTFVMFTGFVLYKEHEIKHH